VLLNGICLYFLLGVSNEAEGLGLQLLAGSDWSWLGLDAGSVSVASFNRQFLRARGVGGWNVSQWENWLLSQEVQWSRKLKKGMDQLQLLRCSVSQPPGHGPVPDPGINYTGSRDVFLEVVILVF